MVMVRAGQMDGGTLLNLNSSHQLKFSGSNLGLV